MRNCRAMIVGGGLAMACVPQVEAAITASAIPVAIDPTLEAAGWGGWYIRLTADVSSQSRITVVDFASNPFGLEGPIGIRGPLHQRWTVPFYSSTPVQTAALPIPDVEGQSVVQRRDSVFLNSPYYSMSVPEPFTENNNLKNGSGGGYDESPLSDVPRIPEYEVNGTDAGVGSAMTFTGVALPYTAVEQLNVAFIIVPAGGVWVEGYQPGATNTVQGMAADPTQAWFPVQMSYHVPEPATGAVLALGGTGFLVRRRRR